MSMIRVTRLKVLGLGIVLIGLISLPWVVWESGSTPYSTDWIKNGDTRVFTTSYVNDSIGLLQLAGARGFIPGSSSCRLVFIDPTPFIADSDSSQAMSANWTIDYELVAGLGYASVVVWHVLYDVNLVSLDWLIVYRDTATLGRADDNTSHETSGLFSYVSEMGEQYHLGLCLEVTLSGLASLASSDSIGPAVLDVVTTEPTL